MCLLCIVLIKIAPSTTYIKWLWIGLPWLWPCIEGLAKSQGKVGGPWRMMVPIWPLAWTFETMGGHLSIVKASYSYFTRKMEKVGRIPLGVTPPRRRFFDDSNLLLDQPVTVTFFLFVLTYATSFMWRKWTFWIKSRWPFVYKCKDHVQCTYIPIEAYF